MDKKIVTIYFILIEHIYIAIYINLLSSSLWKYTNPVIFLILLFNTVSYFLLYISLYHYHTLSTLSPAQASTSTTFFCTFLLPSYFILLFNIYRLRWWWSQTGQCEQPSGRSCGVVLWWGLGDSLWHRLEQCRCSCSL